MKELFKDLREPKFWASICAWMVPVSIAVLWGVGIHCSWTRSEIATFVGAIAGPLAGLAGFLYIYVSFIEQQTQFKEQENQFNAQQVQFAKQNFETVFFHLINLYKTQKASNFPPNGSISIGRLAEFENKLKNKNHTMNSGSKRDFVIEERSDAVKHSFPNMDFQIKSIIQCLYAICIHIDHHKDLINESYYFEILRMQLEPSETNLLFYGYFSWIGQDFPKNELILARFFKSIDNNILFVPGDLRLLDQILFGEK